MPFVADVLRVFIASPSDVPEERRVATDAVNEWNAQHAAAEKIVLLPVKWETHAVPTAGLHPQDAINRQLVQGSDLVIALFWTKIGTKTKVAESGTVEEIEQFITSGRPAMIYFSSMPIDPNKIDHKQHKRLQKYRGEKYKTALVEGFNSLEELKAKLLNHLTYRVRELRNTLPAHSQPTAPAKRPERRWDDVEALRRMKIEAQELRVAFERLADIENFKGCHVQRGAHAVTIIPFTPVENHAFGPQDLLRVELSPLMDTAGELKPHLDSELCYLPNHLHPTAVTELTGQGCIYCLRNIVLPPGGPYDLVGINLLSVEKYLIELVYRLLSSLKRQGVAGPWFVGVSLLRVFRFYWSTSGKPVSKESCCEVQNVTPDLVTIPDDADVLDAAVVERELRKAYWLFWRAFKLPGRPQFQEDGTWSTFEERPI